MSLTKNCKKYTIVLHEIMHTLGFWHEQSRPDRDDYVTVFYENIKPGFKQYLSSVVTIVTFKIVKSKKNNWYSVKYIQKPLAYLRT